MDKQNGAHSPDESKKKLKKLAKREARAMQAVEQANRDFQKAERKLARASDHVQGTQAHLQAREAKLAAIRASRRSLQTEIEDSIIEETLQQLIVKEVSEEASGGIYEAEQAEQALSENVEVIGEMLADEQAAVALVATTQADEELAEESQPFDANETSALEEISALEALTNESAQLPESSAKTPAPSTSRAKTDAGTTSTTRARKNSSSTSRSQAGTSASRAPSTRRRTASGRAQTNETTKASEENGA